MSGHMPTAHQEQPRRWRPAAQPCRRVRAAVYTAVRKLWIEVCARCRPVPTDRLENFLIFTGYPRSGSSILGSLLDAHPQILVAHELHVLTLLPAGYSRRHIFKLIERNSRRFADSGRTSTGYPGLVKGQYNGRATQLRVIGDKKAGLTALLLARDGLLLNRLQDMVRLPLKCLHIVRNPFDMITTDAYGGNARQEQISPEVLELVSGQFFDRFDAMQRVISSGHFDVRTLRYEDVLVSPADGLEKLCCWLGVDSAADWREASCRHLFRRPHTSRAQYPWSGREVEKVTERIRDYDFLRGYTF